MGKLSAQPSRMRPTKVTDMPAGSDNGVGCRSVVQPMIGCRSDPMSCRISVIIPTCAKVRLKFSFRIGSTAGMIDCRPSQRRCPRLTSARRAPSRRAVVVPVAV